jgi:hypothetical protein
LEEDNLVTGSRESPAVLGTPGDGVILGTAVLVFHRLRRFREMVCDDRRLIPVEVDVNLPHVVVRCLVQAFQITLGAVGDRLWATTNLSGALVDTVLGEQCTQGIEILFVERSW